jgi:hypothetical protein
MPQREEANKTVTVHKQDDRFVLRNTLPESGTYTIFNLTGSMVKRGMLSPGDTLLDIDSGVHIIRITAGEDNFALKIF